jgi:prepilin-type N-terminal cleavage/methylation domain-containing protein
MADRRAGFTLVELLIVMVVLGVLAAIVIPKFTSSRERAFVSTLKADLRNLSSLQEIHHGEHVAYSADQAALRFTPSDGVTVTIGEANGLGWSATASHTGSPTTCAVFYGQAAAVAPATVAGVVACTG